MNKTKIILFSLGLAGLVACSDDKPKVEIPMPDQTEDPSSGGSEPVTSSRDELYRPQVHYTPAKNWINDPNGMVYADGVWHLYYQYNPAGNDWGNMSWGHAVSTDLMHWQEKNVAMTPNEYGDIFSGSAIIDKDNVAGFGANALLAFYTASGAHQQQCLAYSTDGGNTFKQYEGNPVIKNTDLADFRDPKVFYHQESGQYIMSLARGWDCSIEFWGSSNLKNWTKLSSFRSEVSRCNQGQWECPDLIRLPYQGGEKWLLIVSTNPGGPMSGSGTMYFVGDFDGNDFTADELDYPLWLDYGPDNYAGVTWSNTPSGKAIFIGWMNNWNYSGNVPCSPWRSAMTLPRELTLEERAGKPVLASKVVSELDGIAGNWQTASNGICNGGDAYEMVVKLNPSERKTLTIGNDKGEYMEFDVNPGSGNIYAKRNSNTGATSFHSLFSLPSISAPYDVNAEELELHFYVDASSIEIISGDGLTSLTCLVFPGSVYDRITGADEVTFRPLNSIW